jgi:hypothetical protein
LFVKTKGRKTMTDGIAEILVEVAAGVIGSILVAFGFGMIFKESRSDRSDSNDKTKGEHKDLSKHKEYFKKLKYRYVVYTRKKKSSTGKIKCIRFYKDIKFFEFDFITLELLRYRNPKLKKQHAH